MAWTRHVKRALQATMKLMQELGKTWEASCLGHWLFWWAFSIYQGVM